MFILQEEFTHVLFIGSETALFQYATWFHFQNLFNLYSFVIVCLILTPQVCVGTV